MHEGEQWQVFSENGQPVVGRGESDDVFAANPALVMGNAHVWLWRQSASGTSVLLQKRSLIKKSSPGMYHVSAAGHINVGETALEAAVRETREEIGVVIDPARLYLVHVTRSSRHLTSLLHVFTYQLAGDESFSFDDGEVDAVRWYDLEVFRAMTESPAAHELIDQGSAYFEPLIAAIERRAT
jgi:8-oxo-dGTP pyrophosphatase MutT (NUDIX family)